MATVASHRLGRCYCNGSVQSTADNNAPAAIPVSGAADVASDHRVCSARIFEVEFVEKQVTLGDESGSSGITSTRFCRKRPTAGNRQGLGSSIRKHSRSTNASCLMQLKKSWQGFGPRPHGLATRVSIEYFCIARNHRMACNDFKLCETYCMMYHADMIDYMIEYVCAV